MVRKSKLVAFARENEETLVDKAQEANEAQDSADPAIMQKASDFDEEIKALQEQGQVGGDQDQDGGETEVSDAVDENADESSQEGGESVEGEGASEESAEESSDEDSGEESSPEEAEQELDEAEKESQTQEQQQEAEDTKKEQAAEAMFRILDIGKRYYQAQERGYLSPIAQAIMSQELDLAQSVIAHRSNGFAVESANGEHLGVRIKKAIIAAIEWIKKKAKEYFDYISNFLKDVRAKIGIYNRNIEGIKRRLVQAKLAEIRNGEVRQIKTNFDEVVAGLQELADGQTPKFQLKTFFKPNSVVNSNEVFRVTLGEIDTLATVWPKIFGQTAVKTLKHAESELTHRINNPNPVDIADFVNHLTEETFLQETGAGPVSSILTRGLNSQFRAIEKDKIHTVSIGNILGRYDMQWVFANASGSMEEAIYATRSASFKLTDTMEGAYTWEMELSFDAMKAVLEAYDKTVVNNYTANATKFLDNAVKAYTNTQTTFRNVAAQQNEDATKDAYLINLVTLMYSYLNAAEKLYIAPLKSVVGFTNRFQSDCVRAAVGLMHVFEKGFNPNAAKQYEEKK